MAQLTNTIVNGDLRVTGNIYGNLSSPISDDMLPYRLRAYHNYGIQQDNANNCLESGFYYASSNGPGTAIGNNQSASALLVHGYSNDWSAQLAQDFVNGALFVRGRKPVNGTGTWQNWLRIPYSTTKSVGSSTVPIYLNESGALSTCSPSSMSVGYADYLNYTRSNEINFTAVPTTNNYWERTWFNYNYGNTGAVNASYPCTDYYFGNRNHGVSNVTVHAGTFAFNKESTPTDNSAWIDYNTSTGTIDFCFK